MLRTIAALGIFFSFLASPAFGLSPFQAIETAVESAPTSSSGDALSVLVGAGATPGSILTLEALPGGGYMAEVEVLYRQRSGRLPLRVSSEGHIDWQPSTAYAEALLAMMSGDYLPESKSTSRWSQVVRLPAFPIIITSARMVTPLGPIALQDSEEQAAEDLFRQVQQWLEVILRNEPGVATVDILIDPRLGFGRLFLATRVIAAHGLHTMHIISMGADDLVVRSVRAPVVEIEPEKRFVMSMIPGDGSGADLRVAGPGQAPEDLDSQCLLTGDCQPLDLPGDLSVIFAVESSVPIAQFFAVMEFVSDHLRVQRWILSGVQR